MCVCTHAHAHTHTHTRAYCTHSVLCPFPFFLYELWLVIQSINSFSFCSRDDSPWTPPCRCGGSCHIPRPWGFHRKDEPRGVSTAWSPGLLCRASEPLLPAPPRPGVAGLGWARGKGPWRSLGSRPPDRLPSPVSERESATFSSHSPKCSALLCARPRGHSRPGPWSLPEGTRFSRKADVSGSSTTC